MGEVRGGNISARGKFVKPKRLTVSQHFKSMGLQVMMAGRGSATVESLCKHVSQFEQTNASCPLPQGSSNLALTFGRLPSIIAAGDYEMEINAGTETGERLLCMKGALHVNFGAEGQVLRKLQSATSSCTKMKASIIFAFLYVLKLIL